MNTLHHLVTARTAHIASAARQVGVGYLGLGLGLIVGLTLAVILTLGNGWSGTTGLAIGATTTERIAETPTVPTFRPTVATSVPIAVSGPVSAATEVTVRAQTSGRVRTLPVSDGSTVAAGTLLAAQDSPAIAASARAARAEAQAARAAGAQTVQAQAGAAETASIAATSASTSAALSAAANAQAVRAARDALVPALTSAAVAVTATLDFIDANRSAFSADVIAAQEALQIARYGAVQPYLSGGILRPAMVDESFAESFARLVAPAADLSSRELLTLTAAVDTALAETEALLALAESDVFDEATTEPGSERYVTFAERRRAITTATQKLRRAHAELLAAGDEAALATTRAARERAVAAADAATAAKLTDLKARAADARTAAAAARADAARARAADARLTAPVAGVVGRVLVDRGAYVAAGEPILTLIGDTVRELTVRVPVDAAASVPIGTRFETAAGATGEVSHVSGSAQHGAVTVTITLTDAPPVGSMLTGTLAATPAARLLAVNRAAVGFASAGAYLESRAGERYPVTIRADVGETLYVTAPTWRGAALVPPRGVSNE